MSLADFLRKILGKLYRFQFVKYVKDEIGVPVRHAIFGKKEFYKVLDIVRSLEKSAGREPSLIFDIGASVGDKAYVLARAFPRATILCFEPHPEAFHALQRRLASFGDRVRCFNFGFYNTNGTLDFFAGNSRDSSSSGTSSFVESHERTKAKVIKAEVRRLDDFIQEMKIAKIDFMKVDVEDAEKGLIEGGEKALSVTDNLFMEIVPLRHGTHSHDYIDILEKLHRIGFSLYGVYEDFFFTKLAGKN